MEMISTSDASKNFGDYVDRALVSPLIVTKESKPIMVSMSLEYAEDLLTKAGIEKGLEDIKANRTFIFNQETSKDMLAEFKNRYVK